MKIMSFPPSLNYKNDSVMLSYQALRRLIGILGILLPFINVIGGYFIAKTPIQVSISNYYYTNMRDFYVGLLFVISLFLITYKGYDKLDLYITTLTGLSGLGVALFPCCNELYQSVQVGIFQLAAPISDIFHLIFTSIFLILLAVNSLFLFTKSNEPKQMTQQKKFRNTVYIVCGIIILLSILVAAFGITFLSELNFMENGIFLLCETIALSAFGISWLVKGETILKDREATNVQVILDKVDIALN